MTADTQVARQAEAPGAVISRGPGGPRLPRPSRRRDAILVVILLAALARAAQQAEAPGAVISRGPGGPRQPRPSRERNAILIVVFLAGADLVKNVAIFVIVLAAARGVVRDSQI